MSENYVRHLWNRTLTEFDSWRSYENFAYAVKRKSRYIRDTRAQSFLDTVLTTSSERRKVIPTNSIFWRAQQGHGWHTESQEDVEYDVPAPLDSNRMKPLLNSAREGRVNPKGIPCLYLSTDKDTAMAEVRPWLGLRVSVGQFKVSRELVIMDCSVLHGSKRHWYFEEPDAPKRETAVWATIDHAFSEPVNSDDSTADYAPTQVLAEMFRSNGYDGIVYRSLLGEGHNIALFDIDSAELINCFLYEPKSIVFTFNEIANPYFVKKHLNEDEKKAVRNGHNDDDPTPASLSAAGSSASCGDG